MFTKEAFSAANQNTDSDFPTIPSGTYDLVVERMEIKAANDASSNSQTFTIGFSIHEDADEYAKQWIWYRNNIIKRNGMPNEIGMQNVNMMLNKLSAGQFSIEHFETRVNDDGEEEIINTEKVFNRFIGTEARFAVKHEKQGEYDNYTFTFKSLAKATYADAPPNGAATNSADDLEENVAAPEDEYPDREVKIGDFVQYENQKGKMEFGTITQYIESQDENVPSMLMIDPIAKSKKVTAVPATKCSLLPDEYVKQLKEQYPWLREGDDDSKLEVADGETVDAVNAVPFDSDADDEELLEEEEDEILHLVKGAKVKATWQGEEYVGKVHAIDEVEGIVKVAYNGKARRHKREDVTVVG